MANYNFNIPVGTTGTTYSATIDVETYGCDESEEYITNPLISFRYEMRNMWNNYYIYLVDTATSYQADTNYGNRGAIALDQIVNQGHIYCVPKPDGTGARFRYNGKEGASLQPSFVPSNVFTNQQVIPHTTSYWTYYEVYGILEWVFSTNIPIFATTTERNNYILNGAGIRNAINYKEPDTAPDGMDFEITNVWTHGTWYTDTQPQVSQINYRNFRGKMTDGKFALYPIPNITDGKLKMGIKNDATFYDMEYSTDGRNWTPTDTFPFEYFLRRRINELGEFDYALSFSNTKIPIFKDEETAQDYLDDEVPITDADNWNEIAQEYPTQIVTGEEEEQTTMGEVFTRSFFSQQYICSVGAIQEISNAFFDTSSGGIVGKFEDIKKGLEMYGESVVDSIQNCTFYPFSLSTVFTNVSNQNYIYFGGYKFDLQNNTVDKILFPNGYLDLGSFDIGYQWGHSYRSYSPYTRLFVYLPYIGWCELDIARYVGKTASVRYYIDTRTGGCLACIFANSVLVDYFNGQIGVQMPLKLTDYSAYANAQIQTLLGGASGMQQSGQVIGQTGQAMMQAGATMGELALGGLALGGLAVGVQGTKTLYGLTQNNINNFNKTKGASTSMLNQYLPQYVMFMIETQECDITPYEYALMGRPTNASGMLMEFSGYLEVDTVDLKCPYATDEERAEIIAQLQKGVYITEQI